MISRMEYSDASGSKKGSWLNIIQYIEIPRDQISTGFPAYYDIDGSQHSGEKKWVVPADFVMISLYGSTLQLTPKSHSFATSF